MANTQTVSQDLDIGQKQRLHTWILSQPYIQRITWLCCCTKPLLLPIQMSCCLSVSPFPALPYRHSFWALSTDIEVISDALRRPDCSFDQARLQSAFVTSASVAGVHCKDNSLGELLACLRLLLCIWGRQTVWETSPNPTHKPLHHVSQH